MKKKNVALMLTVILTLTLCGCGNAADSENADENINENTAEEPDSQNGSLSAIEATDSQNDSPSSIEVSQGAFNSGKISLLTLMIFAKPEIMTNIRFMRALY